MENDSFVYLYAQQAPKFKKKQSIKIREKNIWEEWKRRGIFHPDQKNCAEKFHSWAKISKTSSRIQLYKVDAMNYSKFIKFLSQKFSQTF